MTISLLRTDLTWWVERDGRAAPIDSPAGTTAELLADTAAIHQAYARAENGEPVADLKVQAPLTIPCRVVAQMVNYASHARESGFDPGSVPATFFRKSSDSISGPSDPIVSPHHVRLLDYEVELGLVMGAPVPVGTVVTEQTLPDYVAGLVVANDVSARDVQLTKGQFYESKSYPTFTPVGPRLVLLEPGDFARLDSLRLTLRVNGETRQDAPVTDMIHRPAASLTALARFQSLAPGDVLLTGTPGGTALHAPPMVVEKIAALLPPSVKWRLFFAQQEKNQAYLRPGDVVEATIRTEDGTIDLGTQRTPVAEWATS
ncbi:MAG: fumarylacetoacetate hydrolase family protein [Candidatus Nanopelagicales bacterium]